MADRTYKIRGLVLKKTKLAEKDLIVSLLAEDGSLVQGVAKGARKPGGSYAARLELFAAVDVMLAHGRSLDVIADARRCDDVGSLSWTLEKSACAAPLAELLAAVAQPQLEQPRIYDMARIAFALIGNRTVSAEAALAVAAAALWKVMAQIGYRPSFSQCVLCGEPAGAAQVETSADALGQVALSIADGGVICDACQRPADAIAASAEDIRWCAALLMGRYDDIVSWNVDARASYAALQIARQWARVHAGKNLKSLDFLFTL